MSEDQDRIEQIRARRSRDRINSAIGQQQQSVTAQGTARTSPIAVDSTTTAGVGAAGATQSPWMQDRVSLSLEAQIAMIEMRSTHKLSLADMGYQNRQKIIEMKPGNYLKVEPTGCYRMVYHNRM